MRQSAFSDLYDHKHLFKCLIWFAVVFGLMKVTGGAGFAIVVPMVFFGLLARKTEALFFWLLVAVCSIIINGHVVTKGSIFSWTQRGLMVSLGLFMTLNVLAYPKHRVMQPYLGMLLYIVFMFAPSLVGWCPKISFLKLILFMVIYFSYFGVANQVGINPQVSSRRIRSIMLAVAILFTIGSVGVLPFPALSQLQAQDILEHGGSLENMSSLFMGMTTHSQCLGPVVSSIAVIVFADLLFSIKKWDPLYVAILLCCPVLVYKTSSRTGMGAFLLGMGFVGYLFMMSHGVVNARWKRKAISLLMLVFVLLALVVVCLPGFRDGMKHFILKTQADSAEVTTEAVMSSRQGLIDKALYNFRKSPLIGNGFQVGEWMIGMKVDGLVLSAPVEKGVWVTAVLEEGGIIGFVLFVGFLLSCIFISIGRKAYTGAACLFVCTLTNLGEFTFFSMSYTGGFTWAMVFVGLALDIRRMKDENDELRKRMMGQEQMAMMMAGRR